MIRNARGAYHPYGRYADELKHMREIPTLEQAIAALRRWHSRRHGSYDTVGVFDAGSGDMVWEGKIRYWASWTTYTNPSRPQEESGIMTDIAEPLHIPRGKLIERLKEVRSEEISKREEAQKAADDRRRVLLDKVEKLTADQVANMLHHFQDANLDRLEKWVDDVVEHEKFVSKDAAPTAKEHQLDKTIRVLEMASDSEIEIKPTDPVFPLL